MRDGEKVNWAVKNNIMALEKFILINDRKIINFHPIVSSIASGILFFNS